MSRNSLNTSLSEHNDKIRSEIIKKKKTAELNKNRSRRNRVEVFFFDSILLTLTYRADAYRLYTSPGVDRFLTSVRIKTFSRNRTREKKAIFNVTNIRFDSRRSVTQKANTKLIYNNNKYRLWRTCVYPVQIIIEQPRTI